LKEVHVETIGKLYNMCGDKLRVGGTFASDNLIYSKSQLNEFIISTYNMVKIQD
jgi:hypothetical protein